MTAQRPTAIEVLAIRPLDGVKDENTLHAVYVEQQHNEATLFRIVLERAGK